MARLAWVVVALWPLVAQAGVTVQPFADEGGEQYKVTCRVEADPDWPVDGSAELRFDTAADGAHYAVVFDALRSRLVRRDAAGQEQLLELNAERPPISEQPLRVVLCRERWRMRVLVNDEVWLTAYDDTLGPGACGFGATTPKLHCLEPLVQATEPVFFHDDFMRAADTTGDWKPVSGNWAMTGVSQADANQKGGPQANLSANPFAFRAAQVQDEALAVTGPWFWDTYRFEASVRAAGEGVVGLCFYVKDPRNYLAFRWARGGDGSERQLVAVRDGSADILAVADGGWANDQWYRLGIEMVDNHVKASLDEQVVLEADTPWLGQGQAGLWADGVTFADFDDVEVEATESIIDTFGERTAGRWQAVSGQWSSETDAAAPLNKGLRVLDGGEGVTVTGAGSWSEYRASAVCRAAEGGGFGLVACYRDSGNYLMLRWGDAAAPTAWRNRLQLLRVRDGQAQVLGDIPVGFKRSLWHNLSLETQRGFVRARVGDVPVFESFDPELTSGKVGLLASRQAEFDQLNVSFLPPPPRIEFTQQFTQEETMADWASAAGSWEVAKAPSRGGLIWHRGEFHGDSQLTVDAKLFGGRPRTLRLVLAGTRPGEQAPPRAAGPLATPESGSEGAPPADAAPPNGAAPGPAPAANDPNGGGYALVLVQEKDSTPKLTGEIQAGGRALRRAEFSVEGAERVSFMRRGRFLLGYVDDRCVVGIQDTSPAPPNGLHVAVGAKGEAVDLERVDARSEQTFDTTFVKAPWEWTVAKGTWESINRWKCDPRWSFFGGYGDLHPLIWSKEDYGGAMQVEAYMAIRMDLPGPPHYLHPSDLCLTLGGDGKDVLSGYAMLFAARQNTCALLYRKGQEVARNTSEEARFRYVGPGGEGLTKFHRHWFHLVLRRAAGRVVGSVDDTELFNIPDDGSVQGGKVALWSVNNGVMVSRVKIFYEQKLPRTPLVDVGVLQASGERPGTVSDPFQNDFEQSLGAFCAEDPAQPVLLQREAGPTGRCLEVTNLASGGKFALRLLDRPFKLAERPRLRFRYQLPERTRLNLYAQARGLWHVIQLTGGDTMDQGQRLLGAASGIVADHQWQQAEIPLKALFEKAYPGADLTVDRLVIGMLEPDPYLHAGFGGNLFGLTWRLDDFQVGP